MKTIVPSLLAAIACSVITSQAQVYIILHNFGSQNHDGSSPLTDLVQGGNTLYGTTVSGGTNGGGTIFKINTDGTGYGILLSLSNSPALEGGLVLIGNTLYGTTYTGGSNDNGSIYKINTDGSGYTELHSFSATVPTTFGTNDDGDRPQADLITDGFMLYGTAQFGGANGNGTIFKIDTNGNNFAVVKTFSPTFLGTNNVSGNILVNSGTNFDGARPVGGLVINGNTLYGTTYHGGGSNGVVFAVQTDGSGYAVLKYFSGISGIGTNSDGAAPLAGLALSGDTLYGVTVGGGVSAGGNIFKLKTNGTAFASLHDLSATDGIFPHNPLLLDGGTLYGTTAAGGSTNKGTIFMLLTNGANFTVLKNFDNPIGIGCDSKFLLNSNLLIGTASAGGGNNGGTIFGLAVLPQIIKDNNLGVRSHAFGFDYTGVSNQTAIIETTTNLSQPVWQPLQTNLLIGAPLYFSDSAFGQNPKGFYRVRSP